MKFKHLLIYIIVVTILVTCVKPNQKLNYESTFDNLYSEFVLKRYNGEFRSDSLFSKKLDSFHKEVNQLKLTGLQDSVQNIQLEWDLFVGNLDLSKRTFNNKAKKIAGLDFIWLRAYYYAELKEYNNSVRDLEKILESESLNDKFSLKSNWLLASIYEEQRLDSLAKSYYEKAVKNGVQENYADYYVESNVHLGNIYYTEVGNTNKAAELYSESLKVSKEFKVRRLIPACYYHLGKVKEKNGDLEGAINEYKEGLSYASALEENGKFMLTLFQNKLKSLQSK